MQAALALLLFPAAAVAQTGSISGRITDAATGEALAGAQVTAARGDSVLGGAITAGDGSYLIPGLAQGAHTVRATLIGYRAAEATATDISVETSIDLALVRLPAQLGTVVVTVSRTEERAFEAPASISIVTTEEIEETPTITPTEHLRDAPGVDIARTGVMQANLVTRGFNDIFSSSLLVLTDRRYDFVPSLRVNAPWLIPAPNEDIERIEVQLGPGAAVYGPNAAAGVLHIITKSPFDWQGTTVSAGGVARGANETGGSDLLRRAGGRHAGLIGEHFGYKISGQFLSGSDWHHHDSSEVAARRKAIQQGAPESSLRIARRDFAIQRWSAEARGEYRLNESADAFVALGRSHAASGIELTGLGAAQVQGWRLDYYHAGVRRDRLFAQAFLNISNAGDTWLLRTGQPVVDSSRMLVVQVQHGRDLGARHVLLYGMDGQRTDPRTGGTITGRNEERDRIDELGGYLNLESHLTPQVDLFTALRVDYHSRLGHMVASPRAAIVYRPSDSHALRLTYNRAFNTPGTNALFLDAVPATLSPLPYNVRALGVNDERLTFQRHCDGQLCMRSPFSAAPSEPLAPDATLVWPALVNFVRGGGGPDLSGIPAPTAAEVRSVLRVLDVGTETFGPALPSEVRDIPPLRETLTNTIEAGYKGEISQRLRLALDVYYERKNNFIGSLVVETPNVFLETGAIDEPGTLAHYLARFMPAAEAQAAALLFGGQAGSADWPGIAAGTISPEGRLAGSHDVLLTYRNFGSLSRWGADAAGEISITDVVSVNATYSWTTKNLFPRSDVGGWADIALNAPKQKASLATHLRDADRGVSMSLSGRWVEGFPMNSGSFVGFVRSYAIADAGAAVRLGRGRNTLLSLSVQNLFDDQHREFVGAPVLGRSAMFQLQHTIR